MLGDLCYAALHGVKGFLVTEGQTVIIGTGLILGLIYAIQRRYRTRAQKYLEPGSETTE